MSFCNLTDLEAHVTSLQRDDFNRDASNTDEQSRLILNGNNTRIEESSDKGFVNQSAPGLHPGSEEFPSIKQHSPSSSESDVGTSGQRATTPNDSESASEGLAQQNSTSATPSIRARTKPQNLTPSHGSHSRAQSATWKCAVHDTVATSTNSPTSAIPPANTRFPDAIAPTSPTPRLVSSTNYEEVERYINRDGKVGVVICPNYGGGWSTFFHRSLEEARHTNDKPAVTSLKHTIEVMMFDKDVITALLEGNRSKAVDIVKTRAGNQICRIAKIWPLEIRWVDPAEEVFVHEYDGKETLCMKRDLILWNA